MTAIQSRAPHGGFRRVAHRPRRAGRLVETALEAVRDWRRRRREIAALEAQISRDIEISRGDALDREQKERDAWLDTLGFPPF